MLSEANNAFACDLYQQLASDNPSDNLFFSPYSMFNALAMCAEGARGTTAEELGIVLRLPAEMRRSTHDDPDTPWNLGPLRAGISALNSLMGSDGASEPKPGDVKESRMKLWHLSKRAEEAKQQGDQKALQQVAEETRKEQVRFDRLKARRDPNVIQTANSLWGEETCPFRNEYVEVIERHYQKGGISPVDFKRKAVDAARLISDWVEEQTNSRIKDMIPPDALDEWTRLILVNAIYFKGEWVEPFIESKTKPLQFNLADGSTRRAMMMIETDYREASYAAFKGDGTRFPTPSWIPLETEIEPQTAIMQDPVGGPNYPDADGFAMLELPYKGRRLSMVLIAPNRHDGLATIEERLSDETLTKWIKQQGAWNVHVVLPRFRFETGYRMADSLGALGLRRAFMDPLQDGGADFRGMTSSDKPDDQLFVSEMFHKAFVDVNERGTEAAAASAIVMCGATGGVLKNVPFVPVFKANSPFICIIRERPTDTILFMGRVMDPK